MKKQALHAAVLFGLFSIGVCRSAPIPDAPSYIFQIPAYPGTELFNRNIPFINQLMLPFATVIKVYRTREGKPLDTEAVIAYYREQFQRKGWREGIFARQGAEPYLALMTHVFENSPDGTHIQVSGHFYLWIAPKDGMITIYLDQHRISQTDGVTRKALSGTEGSLQQAAAAVEYDALAVTYDSGWERAYENEYLIDRKLFTLFAKEFRKQAHSDPSKTIEVTFLTFRDAGIAQLERDRHQIAFGQSHGSNGIAIVKGKLLILLYDQHGKQAAVLKQIADAVTKSQ